MRSATCRIVRASSVSRSAIACFAGKSIDGARVRILHSLGSFLADSAHGSPSPTAPRQAGGYVNSGRAPDGHPLNPPGPDPNTPDPNTKVPRFKMPALACDAHCHVFGPAAKFPYAADRAYTPPDAPVENLRKLHARLGISRAVIAHASCHGSEMAGTLDAIAGSRGAYRGVACVEDSVTDRELERLRDGGI